MFSSISNRLMGNKGSSGSAPPAAVGTSQKNSALDAINVQKQQVEVLDKKIQQFHILATRERDQAKKCMAAPTDKEMNKKRAKRHLMKSKTYLSQIERLEGKKANLEHMQFALEEAQIDQVGLQAMREAKKQLDQNRKIMDPDKVSDFVAELDEVIASSNEVSEMLAEPIGGHETMVDDSELDEFLEEVREEQAEQARTKKPAPKLPSLPAAPTTKVELGSDEEDEDEQLSALMKEMS